MANVSVKAKAKRVENEASKKQEEELKAAKAKIEEQNKKVVANREKNKKAAEEKIAKQEETSKQISSDELSSQVVDLASKAIGGKKQKGFFAGLIVGVVIGLVLGIFISSTFITNTVETTKESADQIIDETLLGYTAADFKQAILGEAVEKQDLIVLEQELEIPTTITKAGLGNLEIFSKVKEVTFAGKGIYTVNLSKIDDEHIIVDEENKNVTIKIPHTVLHDIVADFDKTTFEDTQKGMLAFGDLSLTMEDQNNLEKAVQDCMREELSKQDLLDKADEIALTKTWEIFNPLVVAISDEYMTKIDWE